MTRDQIVEQARHIELFKLDNETADYLFDGSDYTSMASSHYVDLMAFEGRRPVLWVSFDVRKHPEYEAGYYGAFGSDLDELLNAIEEYQFDQQLGTDLDGDPAIEERIEQLFEDVLVALLD